MWLILNCATINTDVTVKLHKKVYLAYVCVCLYSLLAVRVALWLALVVDAVEANDLLQERRKIGVGLGVSRHLITWGANQWVSGWARIHTCNSFTHTFLHIHSHLHPHTHLQTYTHTRRQARTSYTHSNKQFTHLKERAEHVAQHVLEAGDLLVLEEDVATWWLKRLFGHRVSWDVLKISWFEDKQQPTSMHILSKTRRPMHTHKYKHIHAHKQMHTDKNWTEENEGERRKCKEGKTHTLTRGGGIGSASEHWASPSWNSQTCERGAC